MSSAAGLRSIVVFQLFTFCILLAEAIPLTTKHRKKRPRDLVSDSGQRRRALLRRARGSTRKDVVSPSAARQAEAVSEKWLESKSSIRQSSISDDAHDANNVDDPWRGGFTAKDFKCGCNKPQPGEPLRWYMYNMPSAFNEDLLNNYSAIAPLRTSYGGAGPPFELKSTHYDVKTHSTFQFNLDIIAHNRLREEGTATSGRTDNPCMAHVFYVPYLVHLQFAKFLPKYLGVNSSDPNSWPDATARKFDEFMSSSGVFQQFQSCPHVMFFPRVPREQFHSVTGIGGSWWIRAAAESKNVFFLTIEPWAPGKDLGYRHGDDPGRGVTWKQQRLAPYPSMFHPCTDVDLMQHRLWVNSNVDRIRIVYSGSKINGLRESVVKWCHKQNTSCLHQELDHGVKGDVLASEEYLRSIVDTLHSGDFCIHPPGDTFTRKAIWDSAAAGCMPVLFDDYVYSYWPDGVNDIDLKQELHRWELDDIFVFLKSQPFSDKFIAEQLDGLLQMSKEEVLNRRERLMEKLPQLVYRPTSCGRRQGFQDALDFALRNLV